MQIVETFPYAVDEEPNMQIPLSDGTKLAARVWWPRDAGPVPVILEYLPYRKRDGTAVRDAQTHPYLAGHGYVCVRVDMRGCGESEGLFDDEYSPQELADGVEVVNWLAAQPWCSGAVGMMGISWGGFNGLQVAALAPEPLKAVVSICSTVDRFADDIHYKGGIMLGENPGWAATALSWFSVPPDPALVGSGWRDIWLNRLENTPFLLERWTREQTRSAYWAHGSVCEDYSAIKAAVLAVGGWHDGYRNTMGHLVENLTASCKAIAGPWNHKYPHMGVPGPQIDFLGEMLRWWDHWLKGIDQGVAEDPAYRAYVVESLPPAVSYTHRPGRWVGLDGPEGQGQRVLQLSGAALAETPGPVARSIGTDVTCGQGTGEYFPFGFGPGELPDDQSADDAKSLCFDSAPLEADTDIVGRARVALTLASDQPAAQLAVRLCDLRPDGTSALIAHGFLNLRQREGHGRMRDMPVGTDVEVSVLLDQAAYGLPAGHRLRLALSPSYFPFVWPEPVPVTLSVAAGHLVLPVLDGEGKEVAFGLPKAAVPLEMERLRGREEDKRWVQDGDLWQQQILGDDGVVRNPQTGLETGQRVEEVFSIAEGDPGSAWARFHWTRSMGRGDWQVSTRAAVQMASAGADFVIDVTLEAFEGEEAVFSKSYAARVPRTPSE